MDHFDKPVPAFLESLNSDVKLQGKEDQRTCSPQSQDRVGFLSQIEYKNESLHFLCLKKEPERK